MPRRRIIMIMSMILRSVGRKAGFTLVEILVVVAIIGLLASMVLPALGGAQKKAERVVCKANLHSIAVAASSYAADHNGVYPWSKPTSGKVPELKTDDDARDCLDLLYRYGYLDNPEAFVCKAAKTDKPAAKLFGDERRSFHLEEDECSYTWRKKLTTTNAESIVPLAGDKRHGPDGVTNHVDGRHVVFVAGNVEFYDIEKLRDAGWADGRRIRAELIGFDEIGEK
jgi:prepilin-type N-terminal cleavage/methylation domain-containing protein